MAALSPLSTQHTDIRRTFLVSAMLVASVSMVPALGAQVTSQTSCACPADSARVVELDSLRVALAAATAARAEPSRTRQFVDAVVLGAAFGAATGAAYSIIDDPPNGHEYKIPLAGASAAVGGLVLYWALGNPFD